MLKIRESISTGGGRSPFGLWSNKLDNTVAAKIAAALARIELENLSNVKALGGGFPEYKIDYGAGYRIYFGKDDEVLVILIGGGSKK